MKITTRIAVGFALLTAIAVAALGYQIPLVHRLQVINRDLAEINVEAARTSIRLLQAVDYVQEFAAKYHALGDSDYGVQWAEWEQAFSAELRALGALDLSAAEAAQLERIAAAWTQHLAASDTLLVQAPGVPRPLPDEVALRLLDIREAVDQLIEITGETVAARARESQAAGDRAELVAWIAATLALVLAIAVCILVFRSISGPLRRLTGGTHEVAAGRFDHRLPEEGPAELAQLARDFNEMAARLDQLEEMKRDFVSHVSHELKGPLAAIHETVLLLSDELVGPITEKQRRFLDLARQSATRLSGMIVNLLDVSRLEAGAMDYDPAEHDLAGLVGSVVEELEPLANERGLELCVELPGGPLRVLCDGDRARDVLSNLVGNAIQFSPDGEEIRILLDWTTAAPELPSSWTGRARRERPPFAHFTVADRGPGVPDEHKERIFEKFHQVRQGRKLRGQGVGLGLAISRGIMEAHGGAAWVTDRPGGGSIFHALFPARPAAWAAARSGDEAPVPRGHTSVAAV